MNNLFICNFWKIDENVPLSMLYCIIMCDWVSGVLEIGRESVWLLLTSPGIMSKQVEIRWNEEKFAPQEAVRLVNSVRIIDFRRLRAAFLPSRWRYSAEIMILLRHFSLAFQKYWIWATLLKIVEKFRIELVKNRTILSTFVYFRGTFKVAWVNFWRLRMVWLCGSVL